MSAELLTTTRLSFVTTVVAGMLCAALMTTPVPAQEPPATATRQSAADQGKAARAKRIAEQFERNARVLTIFDREGKVLSTIGGRALYANPPIFSPDRQRVAVIKRDPEQETADLWVLDAVTGASTQISFSSRGESVGSLVWSPDGSELAYTALRDGYEGVYRNRSNGDKAEKRLYQHPGAGMILSDWSMDGRYLLFSTTDLSGGIFYALPLAGTGERTPVQFLRSQSQVQVPRLSPDGRFLLYRSDESGRQEVYVRPFDLSESGRTANNARPWQVSDQGGVGMALWRRDGQEIYYMAADRGFMAVEVSTDPTFAFRSPKLLFRPPEAFTPMQSIVSRDGERVAIAVPHAPTIQQLTVFDREGNVISKVGEAGRHVQPALSPDGSRVAVMTTSPRTGNSDIWIFDVATGKSTPLTDDTSAENAPIWSPDGVYVAYGSTRGKYRSLIRKRWDGTRAEEQLFQYTPGGGFVLTDWSTDGQLLSFHDSCSGVLYVLPINDRRHALERKATEWLLDEYSVAQARFSPDARFIAYLSDEVEADTFQVYVRPFDASASGARAVDVPAVQVTTAGALGMVFWREDGKELYYLTPDWEVMVVDVTTTPTFNASTQRRLFKLPGPLLGNPQQWKNVSADGSRFVFGISVPANINAR